MRVAIVGTGISGLGAAHRLKDDVDLTLYESSDWVGGHSHTVDVEIAGVSLAVDTGFIVYNTQTYPLLTSLFAELGVETEPSNMSFAIAGTPVEYEGSLAGMAASPLALLRISHWQMIRDILRFNRYIQTVDIDDPELRLGDLTAGYSSAFRERYLLPMGAAIWSTPAAEMADYPAATLARFFRNHGLVQLRNRPQWRTVSGGSRRYVEKLSAPFSQNIHLDEPVVSVRRDSSGVEILSSSGSERFDQVIFATHADTTLALLGSESTSQEQSVLGSFAYSRNRAVLHTDPRFMPKHRRAWASWNVRTGNEGDLPSVTYWMNRLQNLTTDVPVFVSLNPSEEPDHQLGSWEYDHPMFDRAAISAQAELPSIQGTKRSYYCGAYARYGFHEDGLMSGYGAADALLRQPADL
ncbi:MAG: FAD-dependent oxidoreductase [Acidimicrobiia bacterium]|nr:FAD-dependent oxidoreductase [Acidimicrobiia bacterium]